MKLFVGCFIFLAVFLYSCAAAPKIMKNCKKVGVDIWECERELK